ncbi:MAG: hypothetical protein QOH00_2600 [Gaiellales bacterium]|nr:hypothetical protein [Gaiellales bacterium]
MNETEWHVEEVACGMCRGRSEQTVAPLGLTSDGPLDLDGRPDEPLRSALAFALGRCPRCGYVGPADRLSAPGAKAARAAVGGLLESKAYCRLSSDASLPIVARTHLCRSWIDDVLGDPVRALTGALFAAWACDDHGLEAAAGELRACAITHWDEAREAGTPAYAECAPGVSEAVRAELLRRIGRFADSVEQAAAALALPGVDGGVEHAISYIADRAARGDRETRTLADAFEERTEELDPRLVSHEQGIEYRKSLIAGAIRGLLPRRRPPGNPEDAIVFDGGGYYVQILVRPETLQVYAEAVDLDAQSMGTLSDSERELLDRLGWTRGGEGEPTANYHRVFEGAAPAALAAEVAGVLEYTLRLVYGAGSAARLGITVITYDKQTEEAGNAGRGDGHDDDS